MSPTEFDNIQSNFSEVMGSTVGDQPTATDTLGFAPYVEALAAFLRSDATSPPLSVSIEGEWGSGKSSFMIQLEQAITGPAPSQLFIANLPAWLGGYGQSISPWPAIRAYLKPHQIYTIQFNAWRHDKQDALWASFALAMSKRLRARVGFFRAWFGDFHLFWSRLSFPYVLFKILFLTALTTLTVLIYHHFRPNSLVLNWLLNEFASLFKELKSVSAWLKSRGFWGTFALAVLGALSGLHKIHGPMEKQLKKYIARPDYADHAAFVETFHEDFARLVRAYAGHQRVFVFIDDLDRCDVPKAAELMQAINLMIGESGNLVFILGMDREKVAAGISLKYKDLIAFLPEYQSSIAAGPSAAIATDPGNRTPKGNDKKDEASAERDDKGSIPSSVSATAEIAANYLRFGSSYLEKFIQLSFAVPAISTAKDIQRFLFGLAPRPADANWHARLLTYWYQTFKRVASKGNSNQLRVSGLSQEQATSTSPTAHDSEAREQRVQQIQVKIGKDAPGVLAVVEMVAPIFGNNPRRLKQFISTFRLALSLYSRQGIFDLDEDDKPIMATPQQIAKILALLLRFPDLRADLPHTPGIFARLENEALTSPGYPLLKHPGVRKLLLHGLSLSSNTDTPTKATNPFSLQHVDISFILTVLPPRIFKGTPPSTTPEQPKDSPIGVPTSEASKYSEVQTSEGAPDRPRLENETYSSSEVRVILGDLGRRYEDIRRNQPASSSRTSAMTDLVRRVQGALANVSPDLIRQLLAEQLKEDTAGSRIVALAIAVDHVSPDNIPFLLDIFDHYRTPFEHYWSIRALIAHSPLLTPVQASEILSSYAKHEDAVHSDSDRAKLMAAQLLPGLNRLLEKAKSTESSSSVA
jgi:hypothetical protein